MRGPDYRARPTRSGRSVPRLGSGGPSVSSPPRANGPAPPRPRTPWSQLTAAETRVTRQIIDGANYEEAAIALFLSPRTIETHLRQIYRKLGVRSRTELTRILSSQVRSQSLP